MARTLSLAFVAIAVCACAVVSHDMTKDPIAADVVGRCFELMQDAYVVNTGGIGVRDKLLIPQGQCKNPDSSLSSRCPMKVKGRLPIGSRVTVVKVTDQAMGESGRCWVVLGVLYGPLSGIGAVEIPTCPFGRDYSEFWLRDWNADASRKSGRGLEFKPQYLQRCDRSGT